MIPRNSIDRPNSSGLRARRSASLTEGTALRRRIFFDEIAVDGNFRSTAGPWRCESRRPPGRNNWIVSSRRRTSSDDRLRHRASHHDDDDDDDDVPSPRSTAEDRGSVHVVRHPSREQRPIASASNRCVPSNCNVSLPTGTQRLPTAKLPFELLAIGTT